MSDIIAFNTTLRFQSMNIVCRSLLRDDIVYPCLSQCSLPKRCLYQLDVKFLRLRGKISVFVLLFIVTFDVLGLRKQDVFYIFLRDHK